MQTITLRMKLLKPTEAKKAEYRRMTNETTALANRLIGLPKKERSISSKSIGGDLPSAVKNQLVRDVNGNKTAKRFRRVWPAFNNQNFRVEKETAKDGKETWKASFPTGEKRVGVPVVATDYHKPYLELLQTGKAKQGAAKLVERRGEWYTHLSLTIGEPEKEVSSVPAKMPKIVGIDLGLIVLLAAWCGGLTLFVHGGPLAYVRRHFAALRWSYQKNGAKRALKRLGDREHRWVTDMNHKIARAVVDFAKKNGANLIRLEDLTGIRWTRRQSRKQRQDHGRSLHHWPFFQLRQFIEYKAALAGIEVQSVNRDKTSQTCSRCGETRSVRPASRWFECPRCKRKKHVDANAAENVASAISGLAA